MQFRFNEKKAAQAVGQLLDRAGGVENYTKILKILYLADRRSLVEAGLPIAGAAFCRMKHGPLASDVYDLIKGVGPNAVWGQYIQRTGYDIELVAPAGDSELSDFEVHVLDETWAQYRSFDFRKMVEIVHELPEWEDTGTTSIPLPPEAIMRAAGASEETIGCIQERNKALFEAERVFC